MRRLNISPLETLIGKPSHAFAAFATVAMVRWWLRSFVFRTADHESLTPLGHAESQASTQKASSSFMKAVIGVSLGPTIRVSHGGRASNYRRVPLW